MKKWSLLFTFLFAGALLTGCGSKENADNASEKDNKEAETTAAEVKKEEKNTSDSAPSSDSVESLKLAENDKIGSYLTDANGKALYYFAKDVKDKSNCSGECLQNWPAFFAEEFEVPEGFKKEDFGHITREDTGEKQTTYKGYPLYYFVKDAAAGDVNGQGVKDVWFIINSETTFGN